VQPFDAPPAAPLPGTFWRVARGTRSDTQQPAAVIRTLEDTPFYARSIVSARLLGSSVIAMHESLSLQRFRSPWVQALLPFRMPRKPG
jgi:carotenoid 1,2-hydratase